MLVLRQKLKLHSYWVLVGIVMSVLLLAYGLAEAFRVPVLTDTSALTTASILAVFISIGLLTIDTLLPIPSSVIMVTNGALFGFWAGSLVSLVGNISGFLFAYWLGRRASPLIQRVLSPPEMDRGNRVLRKWGVLALVLTRPLPILAETTSIMAGVARVSFIKSLIAVTAASLPIGVLYGWVGAHAKGFDVTVLIFLVLVLLAGAAWTVDRRVGAKKK